MAKSGSGARRRTKLLFVPDGLAGPARAIRQLEQAGYRVETCPAERLYVESGETAVRASGRPRSPAPGVGAERPTPQRLQAGLRDHHQTVSAVLSACAGLFPGIQAVGLALYDSQKAACLRMECQGPSGAVVPETLLWSRFPLLRVAFQRREAIYIPDSSKVARGNFLGGRRKSGVLIVPLILEQPVGVLLLAHAQEQPPDSHSHGILLSLVHALEALLENAALYSRLSVSETRYRSIVSAAPFLIALVSARGDVLELNPQLLRELKRQGLRTRELLGANVLVDGVLPAEMRGLLTECLKTGRAVSREKIALNLPRGQELLRVHAVPLRGAGYPAAELLLIGEIITRYQSLIDEAERTERLAAIGRVAASLAHEINNPLQALRSHLELIRSYPLSEEEREQSFLILEREVERLDETTRRMLGFARPTSEVLQPVSIRGLLDQTLALSRNYLHHQQVEIVTEFREPLPPVMAAAGQLIQVFLNIVLNAAHAMQGKGRLEVRVRPVGERAEITFTNNGPPIPTEDLSHIFEPFFTTRSEGTGLGLSISHAILRRHRGTIRAANLPQRKGVMFTITLPFTQEQPPIG